MKIIEVCLTNIENHYSAVTAMNIFDILLNDGFDVYEFRVVVKVMVTIQ